MRRKDLEMKTHNGTPDLDVIRVTNPPEHDPEVAFVIRFESQAVNLSVMEMRYLISQIRNVCDKQIAYDIALDRN